MRNDLAHGFLWAMILATPLAAQTGAKNGEWRSYGGDLANTRYSALNQINASNFDKLQVAWRFSTASFGPFPEVNLEATPLMANAQTFNRGIPGPVFRLHVGETVIVHYVNKLHSPSGIHWHGIELENAMDGTPFTQAALQPYHDARVERNEAGPQGLWRAFATLIASATRGLPEADMPALRKAVLGGAWQPRAKKTGSMAGIRVPCRPRRTIRSRLWPGWCRTPAIRVWLYTGRAPSPLPR